MRRTGSSQLRRIDAGVLTRSALEALLGFVSYRESRTPKGQAGKRPAGSGDLSARQQRATSGQCEARLQTVSIESHVGVVSACLSLQHSPPVILRLRERNNMKYTLIIIVLALVGCEMSRLVGQISTCDADPYRPGMTLCQKTTEQRLVELETRMKVLEEKVRAGK